MRARILISSFLHIGILMLLPTLAASAQISNAECLECHGEGDSERHLDSERFLQSVHADNECTSCHGDIKGLMHNTPLKRVDCAECHDRESEIYLHSSHGKALRKRRNPAAICRDCHGSPHYIISSENPDSGTNRKHIVTTCARCHDDMEHEIEPINIHNNTAHGLNTIDEDVMQAPTCTDCHGSHDIQELDD